MQKPKPKPNIKPIPKKFQEEKIPETQEELNRQKNVGKKTLEMLHRQVKEHQNMITGYDKEDKEKGTTTHIEGYQELLDQKQAKMDKHVVLADHYGRQITTTKYYIEAIEHKIKELKNDITIQQNKNEKLNIIKIGKQVKGLENKKS